MKNTLLLSFIATLDRRERQQAALWLGCELHNTRPALRKLFLFLEEQHFELGLSPSREDAFRMIHPHQDFDDQEFRLQCSYLHQCLEEWLQWRVFQQNNVGDTALLSAYRNRGLDKHFRRREKKQRHLLKQQPLRHHHFHLQQYQLEEEVYLFQSREGRGLALNFQQQESALQKAFMSYKLRLACLSIAHQRVSGASYEIAMLPEILALAPLPTYRQAPAISIYYNAYLMYQEPDNEMAFREFERLLLTHLPEFPDSEGRDLVLLGINFCIRQINKKGNIYFKEALELYRKGLEQDLLREDGYLTPFTYSNITIIAIRSGELDWAAQFLETYRHQLDPLRREGIHALNEARLAYHRGQHREALLKLHQFSDRDFIHQFSAKIIQLKIYYEAGDFQLLAAHIKNTRAYLRRIKHDSYHKQIYTNIFTLTDQLMKLPPYDKEKRRALKAQIMTTEPLTEKEWLLAQLEIGG